jgi:hypothetical protein
MVLDMLSVDQMARAFEELMVSNPPVKQDV